MSTPIIEGFIYDEINEAEFAEHGLTDTQIDQTLDNSWIMLRNRKDRTGDYLFIGVDNGGTMITAPIQRIGDGNQWKPVTAWRSKAGKITENNKRVR